MVARGASHTQGGAGRVRSFQANPLDPLHPPPHRPTPLLQLRPRNPRMSLNHVVIKAPRGGRHVPGAPGGE